MKKIEAVIREEKLHAVKAALEEAGFTGMTVIGARGRGSQRGVALEWRTGEYRVDFLPKVLVILVVKDYEYRKAIDIILNHSNSDRNGDGKIFVSTVDEVIRVRTREEGEIAL